MKHITCFDAVYNISDSNFRKLLENIANGSKEVCLDDFGARMLGIIDLDVTNITQQQAQDELESLQTRKRSTR